MLLFHFSVLLAHIYLVIGTNITVTNVDSSKVTRHEKNNTQSQISIMTEGGAIKSQNTADHPLKDTVNTAKEFPKKHESVKRKGVSINSEEETLHILDTNLNNLTAVKLPEHGSKKPNETISTNKSAPENSVHKEATVNPHQNYKLFEKKLVKHGKPTVLKSDDLANSGHLDNNGQPDKLLKEMKSSSKTKVSDQIPSPEQFEGIVIKTQKISQGSSPEFIMPIVITILVVPMFAILGFMALRRGKEAWKNRHYKRMDFLLDGMYND